MGNGRKNGFQRFVCRKDHAIFVTIDKFLPLNSIDEKPSEALKNEPSRKQGPKKEVEEQIDDDGLCARSLLSHADDQADGTSISRCRCIRDRPSIFNFHHTQFNFNFPSCILT